MPSKKAIETGEYCEHCANDFSADKLNVLLFRQIPTVSEPNPKVVKVGRFCDLCMPSQEGLERKLLGPEFELIIISFTPSQIEGGRGHSQFRRK